MTNIPTIGDQYKHYTGIIYTVLGFVKSIETEVKQLSDTIIVSNSLVALQDPNGHIIVRPLTHLSSTVKGKDIPIYERRQKVSTL